jgi:predicted Zn-dependent protease
MKKIFIHGLLIIAMFFSTWFALQQVDWITIFKVEQNTKKTEEKLGELFWEIYKENDDEISTPYIVNAVDSIVNKICEKNGIDREYIKLHIVQKDIVNAFALPNGHLVIYSDLIINCDNPEELSGVIAHEIAHIELNHVMNKLIREVGLSVLISTAAGNNSAEMMKGIAKLLSSSAFERKLEEEADIKAVDYMSNAQINPKPFADFLYKLSDEENELTEYISWLSTHPESKERAEYIIEYCENKTLIMKPVLTQNTWDKLQLLLSK